MAENKGNKTKKYSLKNSISPASFCLAVGLLLILAGIFFLVAYAERASKIFALRPTLCLLVGAVVLFSSLVFFRNGKGVFLGIFLMLSGVVFILIDCNIVGCGLKQMWPTIMISSGLAFFPAGYFKTRRVRSVYLFPALMLVGLGVVFFLFSMHIVPVSFRHFIFRWWPLLVVAGGGVLVGVFFVQQANQKAFPYMEEDTILDGEEKV